MVPDHLESGSDLRITIIPDPGTFPRTWPISGTSPCPAPPPNPENVPFDPIGSPPSIPFPRPLPYNPAHEPANPLSTIHYPLFTIRCVSLFPLTICLFGVPVHQYTAPCFPLSTHPVSRSRFLCLLCFFVARRLLLFRIPNSALRIHHSFHFPFTTVSTNNGVPKYAYWTGP
jgi:hypothetical protein